jgi:hypothetical protein
MAATQNYASTPRAGIGLLSAANAARDGTGTIVNIFTAGGTGSRIDAIDIQATANTTQGMIRLFMFDGANNRLIGEIPVSAVTASGTQAAFSQQLTTANLANLLPLILPTGYALRASTEKAEAFNVFGIGGDF